MMATYQEKLCSAGGCAIEDDKEIRIHCKSFCKSSFHPCCIGLPRHWQSSSLKKFVMNNFICDTCSKLPNVILQFDEIWSSKFHDLLSEVNRLHDHSTRIVEANTTAFRELSDTLTMENSTQSMLSDVMKRIEKMDTEMSVLLASIPTSRPQGDGDDEVIVVDNVQAQDDKNNWRMIGHKRVWRASWEQIKDKKKRKRRERRRRNRMRKHDIPTQNPRASLYTSQPEPRSNIQDHDWTHQLPPVVMKGIRNYMQKYNHNRGHEKYDNFVRGETIFNGHEHNDHANNQQRPPQRQPDPVHDYRHDYYSHTYNQHHPPNRQSHDRRQCNQRHHSNYQFQQGSSPFLGFQR